MVYMHPALLFILTLLSTVIAAADTPIAISVHDDAAVLIKQHIRQPFYLEELTWESDVAIQEAEFSYLTDLHEAMWVSPEQLIRAVAYLHKKNKFDCIELALRDACPPTCPPKLAELNARISEGRKPAESKIVSFSSPDPDWRRRAHKKLHMNLHAAWTFKCLKLHGFMLGKEAYRHYYALESGEKFDQKKHEHGLAAIKQVLHDQGYLHARVTAHGDYDDVRKTVTVHVTLVRGNQSTFGTVRAVIHADAQVLPSECDYIRTSLYKKCKAFYFQQPYTKDNQEEIIRQMRRFLAQQGFLQVSIAVDEQINHHRDSIDVTYTIDLHRKKEFVFIGNYHLSRDELLDALLLFGDALWMVPSSIIQEELLHVYQARGFLQAQIKIVEDATHYICSIDEGNRAVIDALTFHHVHAYDHAYLSKTYGTVLLNHYYDETAVQKMVRDVIAHYNRDGYLDARMIKTRCIANPMRADHYTLALTIDEGRQAYITEITIEQFSELSKQKPFLIDAPIVCTQQRLEEQRLFLTEQCYKAGYHHAHVYPDLHRVGSDVQVYWRIQLHADKRIFGKTVIATDTRFPFQYIMRELHYKEGDPWDAEKVQASLERLKALDLFESVHLYPLHTDYQQSETPLVLKLYEDDPYEVRTRLGFGLQNVDPRLKFAGVTYIIGATALIRNVGNHAGIVQADVDVTRLQRNFQIRYVRPWLFNKPIKTELQGYSNHYWQPGFVGIRTKLYEVVQQGILMELTRSINAMRLGVTIGVDGVKTVMSSDERINAYAAKIAHAINFKPRLIDKTIGYLIMQPTLVVNRVDDNLQPHQGSLTVATIKGVVPLNKRNEVPPYLKVLIEQSLFIPLDPLVIAFRARFGHIFYTDFNALMPNDRFYLGGANSVRSYESDLCPPVGIFENDTGKKQVVPQGGKTMANINVELRFPLFYKNLGAVAFQDIGLLSSNRLAKIEAKNIVAATGCGLRLQTPIGPLRFDIGWKWKCDDPYTHNYMWFLTFGHAF